MGRLTQWMDRAWYPSCDRNWDDQILREKVLAVVKPDSKLLDLGAGAGIVEQMNFRGIARKVCGIDLDARVLENPMLDERRIANVDRIPYGDREFDIVVADNVLEHLDHPEDAFTELPAK